MSTADRSAKKDGAAKEGPVSLSHKVGDFIQRSRKVLIGLALVILAALAALAVVTELRVAGDRSAAVAMDKLALDGNSWASENDAAKKADLEKRLLAGLDDVIKRHGNTVWAQQAWDMKATMAEGRKDWAEAEKDWLEAAKILPASFIAPVSLQNAAVAAEELGANDRAAQHWKTFVDKYAGKAPGLANAYFALGRLAEESKDYPAAVGYYQKISASWPQSDWTKLAEDRILSLRSRGLAK